MIKERGEKLAEEIQILMSRVPVRPGEEEEEMEEGEVDREEGEKGGRGEASSGEEQDKGEVVRGRGEHTEGARPDRRERRKSSRDRSRHHSESGRKSHHKSHDNKENSKSDRKKDRDSRKSKDKDAKRSLNSGDLPKTSLPEDSADEDTSTGNVEVNGEGERERRPEGSGHPEGPVQPEGPSEEHGPSQVVEGPSEGQERTQTEETEKDLPVMEDSVRTILLPDEVPMRVETSTGGVGIDEEGAATSEGRAAIDMGGPVGGEGEGEQRTEAHKEQDEEVSKTEGVEGHGDVEEKTGEAPAGSGTVGDAERGTAGVRRGRWDQGDPRRVMMAAEDEEEEEMDYQEEMPDE